MSGSGLEVRLSVHDRGDTGCQCLDLVQKQPQQRLRFGRADIRHVQSLMFRVCRIGKTFGPINFRQKSRVSSLCRSRSLHPARNRLALEASHTAGIRPWIVGYPGVRMPVGPLWLALDFALGLWCARLARNKAGAVRCPTGLERRPEPGFGLHPLSWVALGAAPLSLLLSR